MSIEPETHESPEGSGEVRHTHTLRVITWFSVGMAVATLSIFLGRELRKRYKFNRRTPYDFYSSAGEQHTGEFGVGV
jgi:hypothetical protein